MTAAPRTSPLSTIAVAVAAASWGTVPLFLRRAELDGALAPLVEIVVIMAVMSAGAAPLAIAGARRRARDGATTAVRGSIPWRAVLGLGVAEALNVWLLFRAYRLSTVAIATLAHNLAPVFVALAAPVVIGERPSRRALVATAVGLAGLAVILRPWAGTAGVSAAGVACGAGSAACLAAGMLVSKRLSSRLDGAEQLCLRAGFVAIAFAPLAARAEWAALAPAQLAWLVAAGVGPGLGGGLLFLWGLRGARATRVAPLVLLEPVVAIATSAFVLGEAVDAVRALGFALVLGSAAAMAFPSTVRERRHS